MNGTIRRIRKPSRSRGFGGGRLDHAVRTGISFGTTSGIITTLGLLVGLSAGTSSRTAVLGGILTIALADSFSDALGIHISEESEGIHTRREIWMATTATFFAKVLTALTFAPPVLLLDLAVAVPVCIAWGAVALTTLSLDLARRQKVAALPIVVEHLGVGALVVVAAHLVGLGIAAVLV